MGKQTGSTKSKSTCKRTGGDELPAATAACPLYSSSVCCFYSTRFQVNLEYINEGSK